MVFRSFKTVVSSLPSGQIVYYRSCISSYKMDYAFAPSLHTIRYGSPLPFIRPVTTNSSLPLPQIRRNPASHFIRTVPYANASSSPSPTATASSVAASDSSSNLPFGNRMTSTQIRDAFLSFFQSKGHARLPSASLVPDDPTIMLTIAGMVPFKPIFLGTAPIPDPPRATSSQKCIRTNDIENVGVTKRHHTFFEMLGNFSFGDYFKQQAIVWAWQLLTEVYAIPPQRLAVSVYEDDEDALEIWRDVVGVPEDRIQRLGEKDNFWASGPTGPCGPCSEIYFDFLPNDPTPIDLEDDNRFIELYNLVFMQYSRDASGTLTPLAAQNIDTGMGLERMAQVLQQAENNYETDLILPIMEAVAKIAGTSFYECSPKGQTSLKVVGDHLRAVVHLISDGVRPSNIGRGYIVRRLIRRVVRHGRLLGIEGPFTTQILPVVAKLAVEANFNTIQDRFEEIKQEIEREEVRFLTTLERGEDRLEEVLLNAKRVGTTKISGKDAFELYDTFGFPLELTEEVAAENGYTVDKKTFEDCMAEQRKRARQARDSVAFDVETAAVLSEAASVAGPTSFKGYTNTSVNGVPVTGLLVESDSGIFIAEAHQGDRVTILLKESPFYPEGGGQVGDTGFVQAPNGMIKVTDTRKEAGVYIHVGEVVSGNIRVGDIVTAEVSTTSRRRIMAHHTATHLLQAALRQVIPDGGIAQAGSLVDADRLRFDFNCPRAVTLEELQSIENLINTWIEDGHETVVSHMTLDEAKDAGAVAMFGEKYDAAQVRVVDVPGVSMELCGGTHVSNTADIGLFKVISESGPSSGVRRIEAVCGAAVMPYLNVRDTAVRELSASLKAPPEEIAGRVTAIQEELRSKNKELDRALAELAVAKAMTLINKTDSIGKCSVIISRLEGQVSSDGLKAAAESLAENVGLRGVILLASENNGKVSFVAAVGKEAQKQGIQAGKLVGKVAKICGGGGGGRPNLAQAGGRDSSRLDEALQVGRETIKEIVNS